MKLSSRAFYDRILGDSAVQAVNTRYKYVYIVKMILEEIIRDIYDRFARKYILRPILRFLPIVRKNKDRFIWSILKFVGSYIETLNYIA